MPRRDRVIHIDARGAGQTLAAFLKRQQPGRSWADAKRLIDNRHVQIDGNLCLDASRRLKAGEVLKIHDQPRAPVPTSDDIEIVHQDKHLIVIEKPAGMTTLRHEQEKHWSGRRRQKQPTLEESLESKLKQVQVRSRVRVRPVHRLDRDTSGLMLFALDATTEQKLVEMFKRHAIERRYRAVVLGIPASMTIETHLVRDRGDGLRGSAHGAQSGAQRAVTHVNPVRPIGDYTIVECRLETGRTHQIRIHLSERGHPICGEKVYTHRVGERPRPDTSGAPRQALHAAILGFVHPVTGRSMRFESDWPSDLRGWLARIRRASPENRPERSDQSNSPALPNKAE